MITRADSCRRGPCSTAPALSTWKERKDDWLEIAGDVEQVE